MTVTIKKDTDPTGIALGGVDVRHFKKGEVHALHPDHEKQLVDAGIAKQGGKIEDVEENDPNHEETTYEIANKVSHAPQAVDTAAVAARVVNDGVTHDSEGGVVAGSSNSEGPEVTHASDLLGAGKPGKK